MNLQLPVVKAVFWRNFRSYFINPVGYLFICAFTVISAAFAFNEQFFATNMADLEQLNQWYPTLLLLLIPAITMGAWAEERRSGTEELLLTLPGSDLSIVLGKYFACLAIYTVALLFSTIYVFLLWILGGPDIGLMASTYVGYWLAGATLLAAGMAASLLTSNTTVAFIVGVVVCFPFVGGPLTSSIAANVSSFFGGVGQGGGVKFAGGNDLYTFIRDAGSQFSIDGNFRNFGIGFLSLSGLIYFGAVTAVLISVNVFLLGRRHWAGGAHAPFYWANGVARFAALIVAVSALHVLATRFDARFGLDLTAERLHSLSDQTRKVIQSVPEGAEVRIDAFFGKPKDMPKEYLPTRRDLHDMLTRFEAMGGGRIKLNIYEADLSSEEAAYAEKTFNIKPARVQVNEDGRWKMFEVILGVAARSGRSEAVIPFFSKGLGVEYELTRLVRSVTESQPPKIAVLTTEVEMISRSNNDEEDWPLVDDLRKQYKVLRASPGQLMQHEDKPEDKAKDVPGMPPTPKDKKVKRDKDGNALVSDSLKDVKVLIVPMASLLGPDEMEDLAEYVRSGHPTLIFDDPLPVFNAELAAQLPKMPNRQMQMMGMGMGGMQPKGDLKKVTDMLGIEFDSTKIVSQRVNPLKADLGELPDEILCTGKNVGGLVLADKDSPITAPLRDYLVMMYAGLIREKGGDGPTVTRLLWTSKDSSTIPWDAPRNANSAVELEQKRVRSTSEQTLAVHVKGKAIDPPGLKEDKTKAPSKEVNVIFVADCDFAGRTFYELRKRGEKKLDFENISFIINCVDFLSGDNALIELRQKRPQRHTLKAINELTVNYRREADDTLNKAKAEAEEAKRIAEREMNDATKNVKGAGLSAVVERERIERAARKKFERKEEEVIRDLKEKIRDIDYGTQQRVRLTQDRIRLLALLLPVVPVLGLGLVVWLIRSSRELEGVSRARLLK